MRGKPKSRSPIRQQEHESGQLQIGPPPPPTPAGAWDLGFYSGTQDTAGSHSRLCLQAPSQALGFPSLVPRVPLPSVCSSLCFTRWQHFSVLLPQHPPQLVPPTPTSRGLQNLGLGVPALSSSQRGVMVVTRAGSQVVPRLSRVGELEEQGPGPGWRVELGPEPGL